MSTLFNNGVFLSLLFTLLCNTNAGFSLSNPKQVCLILFTCFLIILLSNKELLDIELTVFSNSNKAWRADHCGNKQHPPFFLTLNGNKNPHYHNTKRFIAKGNEGAI